MDQSPASQPTSGETAPLGSPEIDKASVQTSASTTIRRLFLRRCRQMLLLGCVLAVLVSGVLWFMAETQYRSHAILQIKDKPEWIAFQPVDDSAGFAENQIELLRSTFIIERAIQAEGLAEIPELREIRETEDIVAWISQRLLATRLGRGDIYEISFTASHPESAKKTVAAIVNAYLQFQTMDSDSTRTRLLELLDEEITVLTKKIERQREIVRALMKEQGDAEANAVVGAPGGVQVRRLSLQEEQGRKVPNGDKALELQFARDELQKTEEIRRLISDRIIHLTTESRAPARVRLLKEATLPEFPENTGLWQRIAIAGPIALLTPLLLYVSYSLVAARWRVRQPSAV
jgi:hypothetical protein